MKVLYSPNTYKLKSAYPEFSHLSSIQFEYGHRNKTSLRAMQSFTNTTHVLVLVNFAIEYIFVHRTKIPRQKRYKL